jgi:hypothetical protein
MGSVGVEHGEMEILQRADKLTKWLVSYATILELICIGMRAGNHVVCGCSSLAELHRQYGELLPRSSRDALDLAVCHRAVIEALCRLREARHDIRCQRDAEDALSLCRRAHNEVLTGMLASLSALHQERPGRA